jgi:hypothetical protein
VAFVWVINVELDQEQLLLPQLPGTTSPGLDLLILVLILEVLRWQAVWLYLVIYLPGKSILSYINKKCAGTWYHPIFVEICDKRFAEISL